MLIGSGPFVHSDTQPQNGTGDIVIGAQGAVHKGEGSNPTLSLSYFRDVFSGGTPNLDIGSASNSVLVLASADVKGFHYDTNYIFNEQVSDSVRRASSARLFPYPMASATASASPARSGISRSHFCVAMRSAISGL